mgnify:CR=1 FL=1
MESFSGMGEFLRNGSEILLSFYTEENIAPGDHKKEAYQNVVITEEKEDISNLKSFATKTLLKLPKGGLCDSGEILNFLDMYFSYINHDQF